MLATSQLDLAIIGGGPAGTAAAITAARLGAKVGLFEARDFPRHKVCGEFVSAESLNVLRGLLAGVPEAAGVLGSAPVLAQTRFVFGRRMIERQVSPPALSITRFAMDALLWQAAQDAGVDTQPDCEVFTVEGEGPFTLLTSCGTYVARALIVAAGRWSQFTSDRSLPAGPKWIGVKAHFRAPQTPASTDLYFFEHGYCGVQPIGDGMVNACAMVRSDVATSLEGVFAQNPLLAARTREWQLAAPAVSTAPLVYRQAQPVRGNLIFAGDAAAFIDPFAGDGISIALHSGKLAAECLRETVAGRLPLEDAIAAYHHEYNRQFVPLLAAAARVRSLFSLPEGVKPLAFELLRLPGLISYLMRKTRRSN